MGSDDALGNAHSNARDQKQLEIIYAHLESSTTAGISPAGFENADVHAQENWGTNVRETADKHLATVIKSSPSYSGLNRL